MPRVDLVFFGAGGGHRTAANALRQVLQARGGAQVELMNLQEALSPIDLLSRYTGLRMEDAYNLMLTRTRFRSSCASPISSSASPDPEA